MERRGFVRNTALWIGLCSAVLFGQESLAFKSFGEDFGAGKPSMPVVWNAPENPVFYDHPLILKQYGFGVVGGIVAGALGFYIGNAFESGLFSPSHQGYLSFTGIRYDNNRGPFWGGGSGILLGTTLTVFFMGETDEEQGSIFWTVLGGAATTAAAFALADVTGVHDSGHSLWPFIPLITLPSTGAVVGYHVSRWFNDKERRKITEPGSALLLPPRLAVAPTADGMAFRLDALNLSF